MTPDRSVCGDPSETFERYALGLARQDRLPTEKNPDDTRGRREALLLELGRLGVKGWPQHRTLTTTGRLPEGCRPCLEGRGSNLCMTTRCNRECFFCFNPKPRADGMSVHGRPAKTPEEAVEILEGLDVASLGISGGEPLLDLDMLFGLVGAVRSRFGPAMRIDLYTNGDLLTPPLAEKLKAEGVGGLRVNLAAREYDPEPVKVALAAGLPAEVEIPAVPEHEARVQELMEKLDRMGAPHLILHELFATGQNLDALESRRLEAKGEEPGAALPWSAVSKSEETAYRLLAHALRQKMRLSVYYCSCGTQQWIAENALARSGRIQG